MPVDPRVTRPTVTDHWWSTAMYDRSTQVDRSADSINFGIGQPDFALLPLP